MKRTILNIIILNALFAPCLLVFNDVNPITGEWDGWANLIGAIYCVGFARFMKKTFGDCIN